jgi:hypothetical protein
MTPEIAAGLSLAEQHEWYRAQTGRKVSRRSLFGAGAAVDRKRSSRVRYRGYGLIAADVTPALPGRQTTISVRALAQDGTVIDRFTLVRRAK